MIAPMVHSNCASYNGHVAHDKFFALADLNQAIAKLLERMNQRPSTRKRERDSGARAVAPWIALRCSRFAASAYVMASGTAA